MADNVLEDLKVSASDRQDGDTEQYFAESNGIELDPLAGKEGGNESMRLAKFWLDQIKAVDDMQQKWVKRGEKIVKRYRDERYKAEDDGTRRFNSLWCNVEILRPALYAREPLAIVERRFRDKDPTGRGAAQILERTLRSNLEISGFGMAVNQAVQDYLLPGRGQAWVRYEPKFGPGISIPVENSVDMSDAQGNLEPDEKEIENNPTEEKLADTGDRIIRETAPVDYISWTDFYMFPAKARIFKEVTAVGKRCFMTRDQLKDRFGDEIGKQIPLAQREKTRRNPGQETSQFYNDNDARKGEIFEIWSRQDEKVYWVAEGYGYLCDRKDDPLQLEDFFPVPPPIQSNTTTDSLVPVPDFIQYQDQAIEIDNISQRLSMLTKACKVVGVYNAQAKNIQRMLQEGVDNELIPVDQWAAFAEKGGVAGQISMLPLKEIIGVINELTGVRQRVMQDMDRLTGITDIMRGTTDARETMGAQRLKTNGSSTRLQWRQEVIAEFCKNIIKIQADVISKHFSTQTLIEMSGAMYDEMLGADKTPVPVDPSMPGLAELVPELTPLSADQGPPLPSGPAAGMSPVGVPASPPVAGVPPGIIPQQASGMPQQSAMPVGNPVVNNMSSSLQNGPPGAASALPPQVAGAAPPLPGQPQMPGAAVASPNPMPGLPMPLPAPQPIILPRGIIRIASAINLLRSDKLRGFRVEIETDSTIYGDSQQEKADRIEFLKVVGPFMQQASQIVMQTPQAAPVIASMIGFVVRGFKVGRDLEAKIDDLADQMEKIAQQATANPQAPPPNPVMVKAQADQAKAASELQRTQIETQGEQNRQQLENQGDIQEAQVNAEAKKIEAQAEMRRAELEERQIELEMLREKNKAREIELKYGQHLNELDDNDAQRIHETFQSDSQQAHQQNMHHLQRVAKQEQSFNKPIPTNGAKKSPAIQ